MEDIFSFYFEEKKVSLFLVFEKKDKEHGLIDLEEAKNFIEQEIFECIKNGEKSGSVEFVFNDVCYSGNWSFE